jgi:ribosomal protein S18 acetylase RimI-like enzyme
MVKMRVKIPKYNHRENVGHFRRGKARLAPEIKWLTAVDGNEIVGIALNFAVNAEHTIGNLAVLGVRDRWQRRGLGRALLLRSLHLLQERGFQAVGLLVNADNRPNAFALYESAGMQVGWQRFTYSKKFR